MWVAVRALESVRERSRGRERERVIVRVTLYTPRGYVTVVYDLTGDFLFVYNK